MYNLTYNSHFKFGYNDEWFNFRSSPSDRWQVAYGVAEREAWSFKEECYATARLIRESINEPLTVLFSGGADSEVVVRSFHDQGIPFRAAICQFNDNLNVFDISFAVVCCEQLGIDYDLIPLDIRKFWDGEVMDYANRTQCRSPELCSTMWLADQVDGVPIIGSGEPYLVKRVPEGYVDGASPYDPTPWDLYEKELIASWYRHFMVPGHERMAVPGFFQYTPEIMLAFMTDPVVVNLVNDRVPGKRSTTTTKPHLYRGHFSLTPRKKYTGFEKLTARDNELREELRRRWPHSAAVYMTEYTAAIASLTDGQPAHGRSIANLPRKIETRQLDDGDFDQVMELHDERLELTTNASRERHQKFLTAMSLTEEGFVNHHKKVLDWWTPIIRDQYLKGKTHKLFGTFVNGRLMSMVGMRQTLPFERSWALSNLKTRRGVPLSQNGLQQTMQMLYGKAKEFGLVEYYCSMVKERYPKFQAMMQKLVPDYYNEYEGEIILEIPAMTQPGEDIWWAMIGRQLADVDMIIKRMRLKDH